MHLLLAVGLDVARSRPVPALAAKLVGGDRTRQLVEDLGHEGPSVDRVVALDVLPQPVGEVFINGVGTKVWRALGMPLDFTALRTRRAKTCRWTPTVGTPYFDSRSTTWPETSGAQPGQVPTPMMAASPSAWMRSHSSGSGDVLVAPADDLGPDLRPVVLEPAVQLRHEVVRVREADVDEEELLALERVQARRHPARTHLRRVSLGVQDSELGQLAPPRTSFSMLSTGLSLSARRPRTRGRRRLADRDLLLAQVAGDQELPVGVQRVCAVRRGRSLRGRARTRGRRSRARAGCAARRGALRSPSRRAYCCTTGNRLSMMTGASPSDSSSRRSSRGPLASPRAIASICCSPPERSPARLRAQLVRASGSTRKRHSRRGACPG